MPDKPFITLTTDFGLKDPFAGLMKGVILSINPNAMITDISHNIERHNIFEAAQTLSMSYPYFPQTSIHVAVVDPGVGGKRRPILVITDDHYFIGPDNGIFTPVIKNTKNRYLKVIHITASHYFQPMSGSTFHGRDIFAPIAAWLSKGVESGKFGDEIDDYITIPFPVPVISEGNISGEVVSTDSFGNVITNITREHLSALTSPDSWDGCKIYFNDNQIPLVNFYSEHDSSGTHAIINSFGHLELFLYKDNASSKLGIKLGDKVSVQLA
ncbi:MAG: SAM-dependent chlorinase/fluorinase [Nitrospiraceae bacterium]|nr:MAG: SAM-dependent chlorinase/fluorinase [Nitrospiraceae bacterium]